MAFLRFVTLTFWKYYVLKLLPSDTNTFSDATLSDINVVLCYVLRSTVGTGAKGDAVSLAKCQVKSQLSSLYKNFVYIFILIKKIDPQDRLVCVQ